jgi:leucyl aminopeptidase
MSNVSAHDAMEITFAPGPAASIRTGLLVLGVYADGPQPASTQAVDQASSGKISALVKRGDLEPKAGAVLLLPELGGVSAERVLLVSLGKHADFDEKEYRQALRSAAKALASSPATDAAVLREVVVPGRSPEWHAQQAAMLLADGAYRFKAPRAKDGNGAPRGVRKVTLLATSTPSLRRGVARGLAVAEGMALTRDLGNLPGNVCTPSYLADTARALGNEFKLDVEVLERADMERLGMGSALSVGRASAQPCKFIVIKHNGGGKAKPIVLVGKGVTFDAGSVSLKPGADMDEMKYDMCGAAAVLGAMKIAARLKLPINLVGVVPAVENMPGGNATRPGDVVKSMSGLTIEILDTDAEDRLVLCDALTYAERMNPACVVDVATLTGACVIALGSVTSGLFANDDGLAGELLECGTDTGDRAWRLPLYEEYLEQLKSNFADMSNLGGHAAGAVTAAVFLARFAENFKWAHLDIAGTNAVTGPEKGATGRPLPLLSEFLFRRADSGPQAQAA